MKMNHVTDDFRLRIVFFSKIECGSFAKLLDFKILGSF